MNVNRGHWQQMKERGKETYLKKKSMLVLMIEDVFKAQIKPLTKANKTLQTSVEVLENRIEKMEKEKKNSVVKGVYYTRTYRGRKMQ